MLFVNNSHVKVKLAHQEFELANLLKKLTLGASELAIIRDRAEKLRDGKLKMRGDALLPITLATFIFDSLCVGQGLYSLDALDFLDETVNFNFHLLC